MIKKAHIFVYFISTFLFSTAGLAQKQDTINNSLKNNNSYGLRVGLDLKRITQTITNKNFRGFEIVGDYRLTKNIYIAGEIGTEKKTIEDDPISITASGNYFRAGLDYNVHKNLIGMRNLVYIGFRYGYANFEQKVDSYSIATEDAFFPSNQIVGNLKDTGLSTHWAEFVFGLKTEVLNNVFLGMSIAVQTKFLEDKPKGFDNLYIPGFGKTNDFSSFSAGFNYFISYYIPLYKVTEKKIPKKDPKLEEEIIEEIPNNKE